MSAPTAIGFDVETHLIKPGMLAPKLVCLSYYTDRSIEGFPHQAVLVGEDIYNFFKVVIEDSNNVLVAHNAPYDLGVLCAAYPTLLPLVFDAYDGGRVRCTKVQELLINNIEGNLTFTFDPISNKAKKTPYTLQALVKKYLNEHLEKEDTWRLRYALLDNVPLTSWPADAYSYALDDSVYAVKVYQSQLSKTPEIPDNDRQQKASWSLHLSSMWGLKTDKNKTISLKSTLEKQVSSARPLLVASKILREDGTKDTKHIKSLVSEAYKAKNLLTPLTDKGSVVMDAEILAASGHPDLKVLADVAGAMKLLNTYIPILESGWVTPICPEYNTMVESGRTSSYAPNIQNQPRYPGVRECYIPRSGYVYCSVDYDTLELRALAQVCLELFGHSTMAESLHAGQDLHLVFASKLLGIDIDEATIKYKSGDKDVKEARNLAKVFNFGKPGGLGAKRFVEYAAPFGLDLTEYQAKKYGEAWLETFPEMKKYFKYVSMVSDIGTVGPPISTIVRGDVSFTELANHLFQSRAAAGAKTAGWMLAKACYLDKSSPLYGSRPVAFVHDEYILEIPEANGHDAAYEQARLMVEGMRTVIPNVPITASPVLMRCWSKDAKAIFVDSKLVPWEDKK
jgi:DNA polymerase I-like protein with 3'-5' exonuclease and polymerase domains